MADLNVVTAVFDECNNAQTDTVFQYDYGQILKVEGIELPQSYEVHFSNDRYNGETTTQIGDADGVTIPDTYLTSGSMIYAFIFLHQGNDDGETEYVITIPVARRPEISDDVPDPVEQSAITQAIAALNAAVQQTGDDVDAADASANDAEESAQDAEAWAVGERNGVAVGSSDETYHNNSKYYADLAEQGAAEAGYMTFEINSSGHLIYTKTNNVDLTFRLDNGHLIVEG